MEDTQHNVGTLVVIRHAESEWNLLGKWTGHTDVGLTEKGAREARKIGEAVKDITFDCVYTSVLRRTTETLAGVLEGKGQSSDLPHITDPAINERDYGDYTGMNKWEVKKQVGDEKFNAIRRGWDVHIPAGETLKDVYERVVPYFQQEMLPKLQAGQTVALVSHGNTIRALMKYLESVSDEDVAGVEMLFGKIVLYSFDASSELPIGKEIRQADVVQTHA